jgi:two-component system KDP operon response regulator KdpE
MIDDDPELMGLTETWLRNAGFETFTAVDGVEGLQRIYSTRPNLVLLDIHMPRMDGWEVCHRIREMCDIPIIMVSVNGQGADVLRAFSLGVDDYVTKPFNFPELVARVQAVLRRVGVDSEGDESNATFHNEELDIDWRSRQVWVRGQQVSLSPTEFRLLSCLVENRGWIVTHEDVLRKVWGPNYFGDKSYVKLYVRYLRQKIEMDPGRPKWILTERGVGYRFSA